MCIFQQALLAFAASVFVGHAQLSVQGSPTKRLETSYISIVGGQFWCTAWAHQGPLCTLLL
jgi:hypothetical protein